jgi:hypothetical protein
MLRHMALVHAARDYIARRAGAGYALRIDMTKPKPKDQLQKRGRKSAFRPEYILIAKACARFGAIEDEVASYYLLVQELLLTGNWNILNCCRP